MIKCLIRIMSTKNSAQFHLSFETYTSTFAYLCERETGRKYMHMLNMIISG